MKKILTLLLLLVSFSIGARAQFEQDTHYVNASFSNFGINYNDRGGFRLGMNAEGGYFFEDNWMLHGTVGFNHYGYRSNEVNLGAGVRYYFSSNGISLAPTKTTSVFPSPWATPSTSITTLPLNPKYSTNFRSTTSPKVAKWVHASDWDSISRG